MSSNKINVEDWKDHFGAAKISTLSLTATMTFDTLFNHFTLQLGKSNFVAGRCENQK